MATLRELVVANCITIGVLVTVIAFASIEVKREFFIDGRTASTYRIKFF
jgi:hypothetical protein